MTSVFYHVVKPKNLWTKRINWRKYSFHFPMLVIPSKCKHTQTHAHTHRCYCSVRWFWSSALQQGINNNRQIFFWTSKIKVLQRCVAQRGEKKWHKENDQINKTGCCFPSMSQRLHSSQLKSIDLRFLDESFSTSLEQNSFEKKKKNWWIRIWKFWCYMPVRDVYYTIWGSLTLFGFGFYIHRGHAMKLT